MVTNCQSQGDDKKCAAFKYEGQQAEGDHCMWIEQENAFCKPHDACENFNTEAGCKKYVGS